jgi:hypothetical protein
MALFGSVPVVDGLYELKVYRLGRVVCTCC